MAKVDHYMVDFVESGSDRVAFANDTPITSLTVAKTLARKVSKKVDGGAYVVAFALNDNQNPAKSATYTAIGHIGFIDGIQQPSDGQVI